MKVSPTYRGGGDLQSTDSENNGLVGYINDDPEFKVSNQIPIYLVFGDHTRTMDLVQHDFSVMDNVKVLKPNCSYEKETLLFITTVWNKAIPNIRYVRHWSIAQKTDILLPVDSNGDPDWGYMEEYMKRMEEEAEKELDMLKMCTT